MEYCSALKDKFEPLVEEWMHFEASVLTDIARHASFHATRFLVCERGTVQVKSRIRAS